MRYIPIALAALAAIAAGVAIYMHGINEDPEFGLYWQVFYFTAVVVGSYIGSRLARD